jgi:hypothetical protein
MNNFINNHTLKYFIFPVYFIADLFEEINLEYIYYVDSLYIVKKI